MRRQYAPEQNLLPYIYWERNFWIILQMGNFLEFFYLYDELKKSLEIYKIGAARLASAQKCATRYTFGALSPIDTKFVSNFLYLQSDPRINFGSDRAEIRLI